MLEPHEKWELEIWELHEPHYSDDPLDYDEYGQIPYTYAPYNERFTYAQKPLDYTFKPLRKDTTSEPKRTLRQER